MSQTNQQPFLPLDVIELIMQEICLTNDTISLKSTATVSRAVLHLSRTHLFRKITIRFGSEMHYSRRNSAARTKLLAFSPFLQQIADYIRTLVLISDDRSRQDRDWASIGWSTASSCLVPILRKIKYLDGLHVCIENWRHFDREIKEAMLDLFRRAGCTGSLSLSCIRDICDADFVDIISSCTNISFYGTSFDLHRSPASSNTLSPAISVVSDLTIQNMSSFYPDISDHYPELTKGIRRLILLPRNCDNRELLPESYWHIAKDALNTLTYLELWICETWDSNNPLHERVIEQIDLNILPHLSSIAIQISRDVALKYCATILASAGFNSRIKSVDIILQCRGDIDFMTMFTPSSDWERIDEVLTGGIGYRNLQEIKFRPYCLYPPMADHRWMLGMNLAFSALQRNLAGLKGKSFRLLEN